LNGVTAGAGGVGARGEIIVISAGHGENVQLINSQGLIG
jgi:hypothetical protein